MVLLRACCASLVKASASSRNIILKSLPKAWVRAKLLMLPRTTSIPRSSLALSSRKFAFQFSAKSSLARAIAEVVFPVPGGPAKSRFGRLRDMR